MALEHVETRDVPSDEERQGNHPSRDSSYPHSHGLKLNGEWIDYV